VKTNSSAVLVKRGNITVRIYPYEKNGATYFNVADYSSGKRVFLGFSDLQKAKCEAELIAARMTTGDNDVLQLRSSDRAAYLRAVQLLAPSGVPLESAVAQFVEATAILGETSVVESAKFFVRRNPGVLPKKSVRQVVEEFIADKQAKGRGERYLSDLRYRGNKFARAFSCGIADLKGATIEDFLLSLKLSAQSYTNFRRVLGTLFAFAKRRGYLLKDHDELDRVEKLRPDNGETEIYTPDEFRRLLLAANAEFLPSLAIGGLAGLRSSEIERLDWTEVRLDERFIEIKKGKTKTASRRLVPVVESLAEWLAPLAKHHGPVWPHAHDSFYDAQQATAASTATEGRGAVVWKQNALRHSFISYRLAAVQDVNQVALESGNSPGMIHKHYKQLVSGAEGGKWFAIRPDSGPSGGTPKSSLAGERPSPGPHIQTAARPV
jgi:integrase